MKVFSRRKWRAYLEFTAVAFAVIWSIVYPLMTPIDMHDLEVFLTVGQGGSWEGFYYSPWVIPYFSFLNLFPYRIAGVIVSLVNVACLLFAVNVFKGNKILLLTSYPLLHMISFGQMDGIYTAGMALMYVSLQRNQRVGAVIGWILLAIRWNFGGPIGFGLLLMYGDRRTKWQVFGAMIGFGLLSLAIWGLWPLNTLARVDQLYTEHNLSLWYLTGPLIVLLWIPVLLARTQDIRWWIATWFLTVPYFNIHLFVHLLVFPVGVIGLIPNLAYLTSIFRGRFLADPVLMQIFPLWIYGMSLRQAWSTHHLRDLWLRWQPPTIPS
jgi:hypothetical protein